MGRRQKLSSFLSHSSKHIYFNLRLNQLSLILSQSKFFILGDRPSMININELLILLYNKSTTLKPKHTRLFLTVTIYSNLLGTLTGVDNVSFDAANFLFLQAALKTIKMESYKYYCLDVQYPTYLKSFLIHML